VDVGAFRTEYANGETDSAKRKFFLRPSAVCPIRCHAECFVRRAKARCGGHADLARLPPRQNHGRLTRNQDDDAGVLALPLEKRDGIDQRECLLAIVAIGPCELDCQWNALTIADQMTLAAELGTVSWIRACLRPPPKMPGWNCRRLCRPAPRPLRHCRLNFENPVGMIERRGATRGTCELDGRELLHAMINSSRIPQPSTPPLRLSAPRRS
jgi:hypothetical protein